MDNLTDEEKRIEDDIDNLVPVSADKKKKIDTILARAKKNRSISLRIADFDLERLKEKAANDGIPYQTLINTVLHKYITNQLLEKSEVLKSLQMIKENKSI